MTKNPYYEYKVFFWNGTDNSHKVDDTCYVGCKDGYFEQNYNCSKCSGSCKTCYAIERCLSCPTGSYLFGDSCGTYCPSGSTI